MTDQIAHVEGMPPLLAVRGLSTHFGTDRGTVHAVDDVSFDVYQRETIGIVGESGSGKSVLIRTIMSLLPPHSVVRGQVHYRGQELLSATSSMRRAFWGTEMSMIFQNPVGALNPVMRVGRQLEEPLREHLGLGRQDARQRAISLFGKVGISDPERRLVAYPHELSGGTCQRVWIAIAIACSPALLLADEPTTALDVTVQRQVLELIADLQRDESMSVVLITHDLGVVAGRTSRVIVMYAGQVVEAGPTNVVLRGPRHPYTKALLDSVPRLDRPRHARFPVIAGRPAEVVDPPPGCRFASRCPRARSRCVQSDPVLEHPDASDHSFRCFFPLDDALPPDADVTVSAS